MRERKMLCSGLLAAVPSMTGPYVDNSYLSGVAPAKSLRNVGKPRRLVHHHRRSMCARQALSESSSARRQKERVFERIPMELRSKNNRRFAEELSVESNPNVTLRFKDIRPGGNSIGGR
jgi:hypothetical protein